MMQTPVHKYEPNPVKLGDARLSEPLLSKTGKCHDLTALICNAPSVVPQSHSQPVPITEHNRVFHRLKWPEPPKPDDIAATTGRHETKSPLRQALENKMETLFSYTPKRKPTKAPSFESAK